MWVALEVDYKDIDCSTLADPLPVYTTMLELLGLNGLYMKGEPYIFINPLNPEFERSRRHETVHYILDRLGLEYDRCTHEDMARKHSGDKQGWRTRYGCAIK